MFFLYQSIGLDSFLWEWAWFMHHVVFNRY